ncbi:MAG TPA: redoxin domain-containing protein, partial [Tepidisphaeraceae bacterium]
PPPQRKQTSVSVYADKWPDGTQTTDASGKFSFTGLKEPWVLVARHDTGYLQMTHEEYKKNKQGADLYLQAWGKVEGYLRVGSKPQPNQKVVLFRSGTRDEWMAMRITHNRTARTDADGKFVFENVAPGDSWMAWEPTGGGPNRRLMSIRHTLAEVEPGKTLAIDIGGHGRPVIGRAASVPSNAPDQKLDWGPRRGHDVSGQWSNTLGTRMTLPPDWRKMSPEQQRKWQKDFEKTPAGRERMRHMWGEDTIVNADGSFRIDDLMPGTYQVSVRMFHNENGFGEDLVDCSTEFTVPPLPPGVDRVDDPLDIGTLPVKLKPRVLVGQVAPDFSAKTLDGKQIKLSDYRGKYVLLKWFWSWNEMDVEAAAMNKAYETMKKDPNWVIITIGFDGDPSLSKKRIADHPMPGIHCTVPDEKQFPPDYMGSPSTMVIIGPDGKLLARNIQTVNAETEVAKIMIEK